jgi:hypothetical protein
MRIGRILVYILMLTIFLICWIPESLFFTYYLKQGAAREAMIQLLDYVPFLTAFLLGVAYGFSEIRFLIAISLLGAFVSTVASLYDLSKYMPLWTAETLGSHLFVAFTMIIIAIASFSIGALINILAVRLVRAA